MTLLKWIKKAVGYSVFHQLGFSGKKWEFIIGLRDITTQYTHDFSTTGGKDKNIYNFNFTYTTIGIGYKFWNYKNLFLNTIIIQIFKC